MKNPKVVITDNRREYRRKRAEHLWEGQIWKETEKVIWGEYESE